LTSNGIETYLGIQAVIVQHLTYVKHILNWLFECDFDREWTFKN